MQVLRTLYTTHVVCPCQVCDVDTGWIGGCQHRRFLWGEYLDFQIEGNSIKNDWLNRLLSFFSLHVDNYGNVSQFHAGKTFLLHIFYVPAHTCFMCRESATSCDLYRRRQVDVFVLKTVEACAKFHEACQQTGMLFMGLYMTT